MTEIYLVNSTTAHLRTTDRGMALSLFQEHVAAGKACDVHAGEEGINAFIKIAEFPGIEGKR